MSDWLTAAIESAHARLVLPRTYGPDAQQTDCTRAVYAILLDVYGPDVAEHRADLHLADARRPWSNVDAACLIGGVPVVDPVAGGWHVVQGWRSLPSATHTGSGHTLLYWHPTSPGAGRVVEANVRRPWDRPETWGEVRGRYPAGVRLAWMRGLPGPR